MALVISGKQNKHSKNYSKWQNLLKSIFVLAVETSGEVLCILSL